MKIGIVLLNYNSSADCRKCIGDLQKQQGIDLEIIVVDNCSPREGEQDAIRQLCREQNCTFIQAKENRGYNAGNNIGLRHAAKKGYKYAVITNPDMEFPQADYLARLAIKMEEDDGIVVCAGDIVSLKGIHHNPRNYVEREWWYCFDWVSNILYKSKNNDGSSGLDNPNISHYCHYVVGCCLMVRLSFIQQIGYFDERVFLYGEESILAAQVVQFGYKMYYLAEAKALHNHKKSNESNRAFCFKHWKQSQLHKVRFHSQYPFYGKWVAIFSIHCYFATLKLLNILRNIK